MQENGTLPVGPVEIGETHYANSRLGYSVFGARVWTCDDHKHPLGRMFTFVSRVIEKSALYLIFLLNTFFGNARVRWQLCRYLNVFLLVGLRPELQI